MMLLTAMPDNFRDIALRRIFMASTSISSISFICSN